jgi:uncharacterized protein
MRSISEYAGILIMIFYWLITLSAWRVITAFLKQSEIRFTSLFTLIFFLYSLCLSIIFCIIYFIRPDQSGNCFYSFYTTFNALFLTDLVCKFPFGVVALAFLFIKNFKIKMVLVKSAVILSAGIGLVLLAGMLPGVKTFATHEITLSFRNLPPAFDGFRMVQLSDTHLGSTNLKNLLKKLVIVSEEFKPDLVLFTGDLVNNFARETKDYPVILRQFKSSHGNYAVQGNHDYGDYTSWPDSSLKVRNLNGIKLSFRESGFHLLCNEYEKIIQGEDSIYLVGVENPGHPPFPHYADLEKAAKGLPDSAFSILLCHDPAFRGSSIQSDKRFPLTLSGHTHGFQWGINLAGIRFSPVRPLLKSWGGLYEREGKYLYVNRGIGIIGMKFRIDMPAEITLITLKRVEINR